MECSNFKFLFDVEFNDNAGKLGLKCRLRNSCLNAEPDLHHSMQVFQGDCELWLSRLKASNQGDSADFWLYIEIKRKFP